MAEFKWDVNEYIKHGKAAAVNPVFIRQLENASARFHISKLDALKLKTQNTLEQLFGQTQTKTKSHLGMIYEEQYYRTVYDLQQGLNIGWDIAAINKEQVESVLSKPWTLDGQTFSDRIWKQKNALLSEVHTRLTQNMILGSPPDEAIAAISRKFNTSKANAGRLIMTESAYFAAAAQKQAYETLDVEEYVIVATLDTLTSELCQSLDGKVFPTAQFEAGVTAPPFHPSCRTATAPYFADESGERFARGADGETYYVPGDMSYADWKAKFIDGGDKAGLTKAKDGGIIILGGQSLTFMGASGAIPRNDWTRMDEHAALYYAEIRCRTSDVRAIAKNLDIPEAEIHIVKQHIFFNEYDLGEEELRRFDPSYDMAVSWQRLIEGKHIQEMDIVMIQHELLECEYMSNGMDYISAHKKANEKFNYEKFTLELDRKAGIK